MTFDEADLILAAIDYDERWSREQFRALAATWTPEQRLAVQEALHVTAEAAFAAADRIESGGDA